MAVVWIMLLALGVAAYYLVSCAFHPYAPCSACGRSGESKSSAFGGVFGNCRRCDGKGRRLRAGARLIGRK